LPRRCGLGTLRGVRFRPILALLAALVAGVPRPAAADAAPADSVTTVILVRHAEKDTMFVGADQPLSMAGKLRARELARVLADAKPAAIYVTPWSRNRHTAEPLANRLGDTLTVVDAVDETVRRLRGHPGQTVLVVGHSNTIPQILAALTGRPELDSLAVAYDDLFVLTLRGRESRLLRLHYGAPAGARH
jgi:broad specificity phosphatase PhoE